MTADQWLYAGVIFLSSGLGAVGGTWLAAWRFRRWSRRQDAKDNAALLARISESMDAARWRPQDADGE